MTFDDTIQLARKLREQAREAFRLGKLEEASELLSRASSILNGTCPFTDPVVQSGGASCRAGDSGKLLGAE
jgi:hypothetical protein